MVWGRGTDAGSYWIDVNRVISLFRQCLRTLVVWGRGTDAGSYWLGLMLTELFPFSDDV